MGFIFLIYDDSRLGSIDLEYCVSLKYLRKKNAIFTYTSTSFFVAVPIVAIDGVVGKKVQLPCDISSDNDEVNMVLWYKEGGNEPIYR